MVFEEGKGIVSIAEVKSDPSMAPPVHAVVEYNSDLEFKADG